MARFIAPKWLNAGLNGRASLEENNEQLVGSGVALAIVCKYLDTCACSTPPHRCYKLRLLTRFPRWTFLLSGGLKSPYMVDTIKVGATLISVSL